MKKYNSHPLRHLDVFEKHRQAPPKEPRREPAPYQRSRTCRSNCGPLRWIVTTFF
jgi:hypothetical protein